MLFNKAHTDIGKLAALQNKLLSAAARHVKPNGTLIYCTCSLQTEEGEARLPEFLQKWPDFRLNPILNTPNISPIHVVTDAGYVRSLPHNLAQSGGMDGFFIARLRRNGRES